MKWYVLLDVGGTEIKAALVNERGEQLTKELYRYPSLAHADSNTIFANFVQIIEEVATATVTSATNQTARTTPTKRSAVTSTLAPTTNPQIAGVGLAFPGPFDYVQGVSLMRGIAKYDSVYGLSIPKEIQKRSSQPWIRDIPYLFLHDVAGFALGACSLKKYKGYGKILHVVIGTGAGSAFTQDGVLLTEESGIAGVPKNGWLYNAPFRNSIVDDYLSVRGFKRLSQEILGEPLDGYRVQQMAEQGNTLAKKVFILFGEAVIEGLKPFLLEFQPNLILLGGQMTKGFSLFAEPLLRWCSPQGIDISCESKTSELIHKGLVSQFLLDQIT